MLALRVHIPQVDVSTKYQQKTWKPDDNEHDDDKTREGRRGRRKRTRSGYMRGEDSGAIVDEKIVDELLAQRRALRRERKYTEADKLLDQLRGMGITTLDRDRLWFFGRPHPITNDEDEDDEDDATFT